VLNVIENEFYAKYFYIVKFNYVNTIIN